MKKKKNREGGIQTQLLLLWSDGQPPVECVAESVWGHSLRPDFRGDAARDRIRFHSGDREGEKEGREEGRKREKRGKRRRRREGEREEREVEGQLCEWKKRMNEMKDGDIIGTLTVVKVAFKSLSLSLCSVASWLCNFSRLACNITEFCCSLLSSSSVCSSFCWITGGERDI